MNSVVIFDVNIRHQEVKNAMMALGYFAGWNANNNLYYLPHNTLWRLNIEQANSLAEIQGVIVRLNSTVGAQQIVLQRCIVLPVNPWAGIQGVPI